MPLVRVTQRRVSIRSARSRTPVPYFRGDEVHVGAKRAKDLVAAGAVEYVDEHDTTADVAQEDELTELVLDALGSYLAVPDFRSGDSIDRKEALVKKELGRRGYAVSDDEPLIDDAADADLDGVEGDAGGETPPVELSDAEKATLTERLAKKTLAKLDDVATANGLTFPEEATTRKQRAAFLVDSGVTQA